MSLENKTISISLFERLIDVIPYGIIVVNSSGEFILYNDLARIFFNNELQEISITKWQEKYGLYSLDKSYKYPIEHTPAQKALSGDTVKGEKYFIKCEAHPKGFYIKASSYPIYCINKNEIEAAVVVFEDITQEQIIYEDIVNKMEEMKKYLNVVFNMDRAEPKNKNNEDETQRAY